MRDTDPDGRTTRQAIARILRLSYDGAAPSDLADRLERERGEDVSPADVLDHIDHIDASLDGDDERVLVAPPECRDCGFDGFDDLLNVPSQCPECRSEWLREPRFRIE